MNLHEIEFVLPHPLKNSQWIINLDFFHLRSNLELAFGVFSL